MIVVEFTTTSKKEEEEMVETLKKYYNHPILKKKFPNGKFTVRIKNDPKK